MRGERGDRLGDLHGEFAGRGEDEGLHAALAGSMAASSGMPKAAVLPVPVCATPVMSRPASSAGMAGRLDRGGDLEAEIGCRRAAARPAGRGPRRCRPGRQPPVCRRRPRARPGAGQGRVQQCRRTSEPFVGKGSGSPAGWPATVAVPMDSKVPKTRGATHSRYLRPVYWIDSEMTARPARPLTRPAVNAAAAPPGWPIPTDPARRPASGAAGPATGPAPCRRARPVPPLVAGPSPPRRGHAHRRRGRGG